MSGPQRPAGAGGVPAVPGPAELLGRVRDLPAGGPLLRALDGLEGVHLVGGAVRDLLLGGRPEDLDLVVEGDAPAVARELARRLGGEALEHERFGTATVRAGGHAYDLATARAEVYPQPGALPEVRPAPLAQDLLRRDFTIHAIALTLGGPEPGALHAVRGAREDLAARRLRVLHEASFRDDPTRLLRLVRYAARLGFEIEPGTRALALDAVAAGALETVSGARIGDELRLLLAGHAALDALDICARLGICAALRRGLRPDRRVAEAALTLLPPEGRSDLLLLAACARAIEAPGLRSWLDALEFEAREREVVVAAASRAARVAGRLRAAQRPSAIADAARGETVETLALAGALGADAPARRWLAELRHVALEITGGDLLAAGVPEGPQIGRRLASVLTRKLDGEVSGREQELTAALAAPGDG